MAVGRAARGGTRAKKAVTHETGISGSFKDTEYREDAGGGYDGPPPTPGLYAARLVSVEQHTTTEDSICWIFEIVAGKYSGWRGWVYTNMSTAKFKTQQILVAMELMEPEGEVNMTFEDIRAKANPLRVRVQNEQYDGDAVPKIRGFLTADGTAPADEAEPEEEDPDFKEDPKPAARSRRGRKAEPEPEPEPDKAEGIDLDALEEELEDMSLADLKKKAKEFGLSRTDIKDLDEEDLIDAIMERAEEQDPPF